MSIWMSTLSSVFLLLPLSAAAAVLDPTETVTVQEILHFADQRLAVVYPVIQKLKSRITSDPLGVTASWVTSDVCRYRGFYCDNPPDNKSAIAVASIDFNGFQLRAPTLEGFIDMLPDLAIFHANSNEFGGMVPAGISKLPYLYELDLSNNRLVGPFPTVVLGMSGLTFLDIRFNQFTGSVPGQIFIQNLDALFLNDNAFDQLPLDSLGTSHILYLTLAGNRFTGPIAPGLVKALSTLMEVLFINNSLTGCIPYELGLLSDATVIDVGDNQLTGTLPLSLSCLAKVEQLNFAGNQLHGEVPEEICQLGARNLVNLSLSNNYFNNIGPWCRIMIEKGTLDIRNNCVPELPSQRPVKECTGSFEHMVTCPRTWSYSYVPCKHPPSSAPSP